MTSPGMPIRLVRLISWVVASLPLLYFIVVCTMAADRRSGLGVHRTDGYVGSEWNHILRYLLANISKATFWPPLGWVLAVGFAQLKRERFMAQAVLLTGGCGILIAFWGPALQMLRNGSLD